MKVKEKTDYLLFCLEHDTGKTKVFSVISKSKLELLGAIKWYAPWRQYCFFPSSNTIWNKTCLQAITKFIDDLMEERKCQEKQ